MTTNSTLRVVKTFEESDEIMKSSSRPVVRLQAGLDAHQNRFLSEKSLRNLIHNIRVFHDMAINCKEDFLFLNVTGGTLCYWTFYYNGKWEHLNNYIGYDGVEQIDAPEEILREFVNNLEQKQRDAELEAFIDRFNQAMQIQE